MEKPDNNHHSNGHKKANGDEKHRRKFKLSRRWIWILIIAAVAVLIGGLIYAANRPKPPELITDTVVKGRLTQTVEATGELESIDQVDLSFDISGTVSQILVAVGDQVQAGQELARLRTTELQADVERALQGVQAAQAVVNERLAGSTGEAVNVARASVAASEARLAATKVDWQNRKDDLANTIVATASAVNEAEVALKTAADNLVNQQAKNQQTIKELEEDLESVLKDNMIGGRSALSDADEVLGIDNTIANNDFENVLSALNHEVLVSAQSAYGRAKGSRDRAEAKVFNLNSESVAGDLDEAVYFTRVALTDTESTLLYTRQVLDATTAGTDTFSEADLSALKASINLARNDIQNAQTSLQSQLQLIDSTEISNQSTESSAANALSSARQSLTSAIAGKSSQVASAESAVRAAEAQIQVSETDLLQAEANLQQVLAGPRAVDLAGLQADVRRARADLDAAEARLNKAKIISPISGKVTDLKFKVGEQVSMAEPMAVVQSVGDNFRIKSDISESDIAKISLLDPVKVTFDAFGNDLSAAGTVEAIDPAQKLIEGVVYYEVDVRLVESVEIIGLKPGMSADLEILTADLPEVLNVPQRAVLERSDGIKYVRVPGGDLFVEREVKTGLRGDGGKVEIKEGLSEGEEVIITIREQN
ncbi:efflux RND transporter periplasmic adaptor subunit [Patescibacteria group bacterium]|nr:efflux RND transporter periplasmic adaptor subunit [Patescibacteria group bacterium]MBU1705541.1 efflux RND transporter periplasmic adaptor subunit [Patescibacteria group bacterium]